MTTGQIEHRRKCGWRMSQTLALMTVLAVLLLGCSAGSSHTAVAHGKPKVGVILPTAATSPRWENADGPTLERLMRASALDPDVENIAADDTKQLVATAHQMIADGSKVLVVASPDIAAEDAVAAEAKTHGVPVIDYDLRGVSSPADYSLSLDYRGIGEIQGRGLIRGVRSTPAAKVIELERAPTNPDVAQLVAGQRNILRPRYTAGSYTLAGTQTFPPGSATTVGDSAGGANGQVGLAFSNLLDAASGSVAGVLAADDQIASSVIDVLRERQLSGKVTVTGLGASPDAIKAILRGDQFMTVYLPVEIQAGATAKLAAALARQDRGVADQMSAADPTGHGPARAVALAPAPVSLDTVKQVFDSGVVSSEDVCGDELALRCDQLGIS